MCVRLHQCMCQNFRTMARRLVELMKAQRQNIFMPKVNCIFSHVNFKLTRTLLRRHPQHPHPHHCGLVMPYGNRDCSTLAEVMACCLPAPSHYLNQCWFIISNANDIYMRSILLKKLQPSITKSSTNSYNLNKIFKSPRGQWVKAYRCPGPCITNVIATCRKNFSQWESSFLWKLRYHWLKFLRRVAKTLVIQGPGT